MKATESPLSHANLGLGSQRSRVFPAGSLTGAFFVGIYRVCVVDVESQATFEGVFSGSAFSLKASLSLLRSGCYVR